MPLNGSELIEVAEIVAKEKNMRVAVKCATAGTAFTAATTFTGALLGGPPGLAIGAIFGGITSALCMKDQFRSVVDIIQHDLTPAQRMELIRHLQNAVKDVDMIDIVRYTTSIMAHEQLVLAIMGGLHNFITSELQQQIKM